VKVGRNQLALVAIAVGFAALQLSTVGFRYALGHDETVYLSQLNPSVPAFLWGSHRAWGMPLLTAPVALLDAPLPVIRFYLVTLSSLGLYLAYRPWLAVRDTLAVPLAAALFASTYVVVYHGAIALPNYYVGLGAVAAVGCFLGCRRETRSTWALVALAATIGATALLRPSDSLWLVAPLGLAWLGLSRWRHPAVGIAIGGGLLAGWAPWLVEAAARFGGPWARFASAGDAVEGGDLRLNLQTVELYLRLWSAVKLECYAGPTACALTGPVAWTTVLWWFGVAAVVLVGVVAAARAGRAAEVVIPVAVGVSLAFSYFFLVRYGALRFLMPAGAILALPAAEGVLAFGRLRPLPARAVGAVLATAALMVHFGVNLATAGQLGEASNRARTHYPVLVQRSRELGITPPCLVFGDSTYTLAYELGCETRRRLRGDPAEEPAWVAAKQADGTKVAALLRSKRDWSFLAQWRAVPVDVPGRRDWIIYLPRADRAPSVSNASSSVPRAGR
jgi:hypothetical protein